MTCLILARPFNCSSLHKNGFKLGQIILQSLSDLCVQKIWNFGKTTYELFCYNCLNIFGNSRLATRRNIRTDFWCWVTADAISPKSTTDTAENVFFCILNIEPILPNAVLNNWMAVKNTIIYIFYARTTDNYIIRTPHKKFGISWSFRKILLFPSEETGPQSPHLIQMRFFWDSQPICISTLKN